LMYVLGFAGVWLGIVVIWSALAGYKRVFRDWDRAFEQELMNDRRGMQPHL
jgi:hypothetical protein